MDEIRYVLMRGKRDKYDTNTYLEGVAATTQPTVTTRAGASEIRLIICMSCL